MYKIMTQTKNFMVVNIKIISMEDILSYFAPMSHFALGYPKYVSELILKIIETTNIKTLSL